MDEKFNLAKQILNTYNQEHLLYFYDELSEQEKDILINQILRIDFNTILTLYKNSMRSNDDEKLDFSPLPHFEKDEFTKTELDYFISLGEEKIKSNSVAVVTMAGGQGTRLGYKGPKGTYELEFEETNTKKSLFQIMCEDLKRINTTYNVQIPWYIMTSKDNDQQTKDYFKQHNYWNYPQNKIKFFTQDKLPLIDVSGKLILQETY